MIENVKFNEQLKRAEAGDVISMFFVGVSGFDGTAPVAPEEKSALAEYWLSRSAAGGYTLAYRFLGKLYSVTPGKERAAYEAYLEAAKRGDAISAFEVAEYYTGNSGDGLFDSVAEQLREKAIEYYLVAYRAGVSLSGQRLRFELGVTLDEDAPDVRPDHNETFELANLGLMHYEFEAAHLYMRDDLNYKNYALSVSYMKRAADQGYLPAVYFMGFMYFKGIGVSKDKAAALGWFERALNTELIGSYPGCIYHMHAATYIEKINKTKK